MEESESSDPAPLRRGTRVLVLRCHGHETVPPQWSQGSIHSYDDCGRVYRVRIGGRVYPLRRPEIAVDRGFRIGDHVTCRQVAPLGIVWVERGKIVRLFSNGKVLMERVDGSRISAAPGQVRHESQLTAVRRWFLRKWGI